MRNHKHSNGMGLIPMIEVSYWMLEIWYCVSLFDVDMWYGMGWIRLWMKNAFVIVFLSYVINTDSVILYYVSYVHMGSLLWLYNSDKLHPFINLNIFCNVQFWGQLIQTWARLHQISLKLGMTSSSYEWVPMALFIRFYIWVCENCSYFSEWYRV